LKLIYLADSKFPSRAANSIQVMKMCQAFTKNGHQVTLIFPSWKTKKTERDTLFTFYGINEIFQIIAFPWNIFPRFRYLYSIAVAAYIFLKKKDVIYSRDAYASIMCTLLRQNVIFESHRPPIIKKGFTGFLFRRFYRHNKLIRIIVISNALKKFFIRNNISDDKLLVAHDAAEQVNGTTVKLNDNQFVVGYIGHLYQGRGIKLILEMADRLPEIRFRFVGGNEDDLLYWKKKSEKIGNVEFLGFYPPYLTEKFRLACDILIAPYEKKSEYLGR